ncbi:MAG: hypothetical protein WCW16_05575 [Candidatus Magasanikbacteria bacterium]
MKKEDTFSYKGWLISDSFIKRSFASLGYHFMGVIFIYLMIMVVALVIGGIAWIIGSIF